MALGVCKWCAQLQNYPLHVLFIADQAWSIRLKRCAAIQTAMKFSTTGGKMLSIPFNALSEASSMSFTYPPTTKLSKLFTPVFVCNPCTQNQKKSSPLFNKHSSSPFLRFSHRCHHCGTIHSWVSCIPWSFIKVWFFVFNRFCMVCVFNNVCVICSLLCGFCIQCLCGFINPWFNTIVSTSSSVEIQQICEFTLYFPADHA